LRITERVFTNLLLTVASLATPLLLKSAIVLHNKIIQMLDISVRKPKALTKT